MAPEQYSPYQNLSTSYLPAKQPNLATKLRHARRASGLMAEEIAAQIGVTPRALRYWEAGERAPRDEVVATIARLTGFPLAWFYRDEEVT